MKLYIHGRVPKGTHAVIDDEDYERCKHITWRLDGGYVMAIRDGRRVTLQNFVLGLYSDILVDHINGDRLDCQKRNLRPCTVAENNRNRRGWAESGYKGVTTRGYGKFMARIGYEGEVIYLGQFDDPVDAAKAYDRAAIELFGEFAKLNFGGNHG